MVIRSFSHRPNVDAVVWLIEEILPLVRQKFPELTLSVVGPFAPQRLHDLAERHRGVKILGFVDDIEECFRRYRVFVSPLRWGGGVKVKILQAMAQGVPIVTTRVGAEGIDGVAPDENVLIGETSEKIAEHVCRLLADPQYGASVGAAGWKNIQAHYSWEIIVSRLENIYNKVVSN